ncbi:hypothetical protein BBG06_08025 [Streptococcus dysgalactiae subsp. equisimilis]|uniref:Fibronectin-binding protein n=2 Tax=Streptococcus TaxID=1301 RepID=A0A9X8T4J5_STREQ|nr:QVPTGV class sortase B protein-sorting domain-containing protein [Streptococcus dysgalactiae]OBY99914.1 hypothetical protein BBG06_08025 [Streptococcus dysgalactiae subsp. equisimilis]OBZ04535.1 hypothetical protein BBG02_07920 [Streptococcus dysgalactiae subsp. equisimilis]QQC50295.1 QVPTGV class sortase B protein-sorting domain-containing protein [Streptococcus dysgalactiae]SUN64787.1 fibronectin-binding protein [Streptococcus dysgalactiae subsp. equisimilis]SUN66848.1 fibronectin-binding
MKKYKALLASSIVIAAFAAANTARAAEPVPEGSTVEIKKTVDLTDDKVLMPKTSFNFTVEPDNTAKGTKDNLTIYPGKTLLGQVIKVEYTNDDKINNKEKKVQVDFTDVKFDKPGIYRYLVKEADGNTPGIIYDKKEYTIDVYVLNGENGQLVAKYVVSHDKDNKDAKKPIQFNNKLKTTSLTVKKIVTGNAGDRDHEFEFTLELIPNAEFEKGKTLTFTKQGKDNTKTDVVATIGEPTKFKLKDGESLTLDKLPIGISYKINETDAKGYIASAQLTEVGKGAVEYNLGDEKESDNTADTIEVTNNKEGIIPTGVVNTIAPFAALAIVAIGGSLYFVKRKKA